MIVQKRCPHFSTRQNIKSLKVIIKSNQRPGAVHICFNQLWKNKYLCWVPWWSFKVKTWWPFKVASAFRKIKPAVERKTRSLLLFCGNSNHPLVMEGNIITFFPWLVCYLIKLIWLMADSPDGHNSEAKDLEGQEQVCRVLNCGVWNPRHLCFCRPGKTRLVDFWLAS